MKYLADERGVAFILEFILVAIVLAVVSYAVYTSLQVSQKTGLSVSSSTSTSTLTPGTKTTVLAGQQVSVTYPQSWRLSNAATSTGDHSGVMADTATIVSPGGLTIEILTGLDATATVCASCKIVSTEPVTAFGQSLHLNYSTVDDSAGNVNVMMLSAAADCVQLCQITPTNHLHGGVMRIRAYYGSDTAPQSHTLASLKGSADLKAAKAIVASLYYAEYEISDLNVRFASSAELAGLDYAPVHLAGDQAVNSVEFSSFQLEAAGCSLDTAPLGYLTYDNDKGGTPIKNGQGANLYYLKPDGSCKADKAQQNYETLQAALKPLVGY